MEESSRQEEMEEALTNQTQNNLHDNRRHDSLRDVERPKKFWSNIKTSKMKKQDKRQGSDRVQQIQLNSKQIVAIYD